MVKRLLIYLFLVAVMCGCEHKELCMRHPHTAKVRIDVDWSGFTHKETPTGMTVMVFPHDGGEPVTQLSNNTSHVYMQLEEGYYHSIAFNQSVTEFGSLQFDNMDSYENAQVVAETAATKWYTKGEERVAAEPEWFGADRFEMAQVSAQMIEETATQYGEMARSTPEYLIGTHQPLNTVYTINIQVNIEGIYNLRSARGALQGMAEGYKLAADEPLASKVTHLVEEWKMSKDQQDPTKGYITATIHSFGLPAGHGAQEQENIFTLSLLLADNKTQLDYTMQVGNKWSKSPDEDMTLLLNLTLPEPLPDVEPEGGSSGGFDATVEDWGDEIEHEILM